MKRNQNHELLAYLVGASSGWLAATLVLWVWARLPSAMVGLMLVVGLIPVGVGLGLFVREILRSAEKSS